MSWLGSGVYGCEQCGQLRGGCGEVGGALQHGFVHAVTEVARRFDPTFDAATVEMRPSSGGKYLSVTVTITATSREQLDEMYRTLSTHPMVKVVL